MTMFNQPYTSNINLQKELGFWILETLVQAEISRSLSIWSLEKNYLMTCECEILLLSTITCT